jgi:hypothetical protein
MKDTYRRGMGLMSWVGICMKICPVEFCIWDDFCAVLNVQGTVGDSW